jgi:lysophospholipase L1-like esterase
VNDVTSPRAARDFVSESARLWTQVRQRTGVRWAVVCGLPPMELLTAMPQPLRWYLGRYAAGLDAALRGWAAGEGLGFCSLSWAADPSLLAPDGFHPGAALYPLWARRLADLITGERARWATQ